MNSYSLAIVGLLCVSAVLAQDFTQFNTNLFDVDSNSAGDSPYWWMSKGSPFKRSFQIAAGGPQQQRFDNQFLNPSAKYSGPGYLPPVQPQPQPSVTVQRPQPPPPPPTPSPRVPCGGNRVCVNRNQCIGGLVDASQVNGANRKPECDQSYNEVCCTVRVPPPPPPRPTQAPTAAPTTQRPTYIPPPSPPTPCQPNSVCVQAYQCASGSVNLQQIGQRPLAQSCQQPQVCCRVEVIRTAPSTPRPVVTPRPAPPAPPKKPFVGQQYIPPRDNELPSSNNVVNQYLPPDNGEDIKSQPSNNNADRLPRPSNDNAAVVLPPIQCPAAMNCTDIQFCAADGTISKTSVTLTPEQEAFRVPLSDCRDLSKGIQSGKCCRDKDYTDPWPTSILGQYNATILGFDDGSYKGPNGRNQNQKQNGGSRGPNGPNGPNGPSGPFGPNGPSGPFGPSGPSGPNGPFGPNGPNGPAGNRGQSFLSQPITPQQTIHQFSRTPYPNNQNTYTQAPFNPNAIPNGNKPFVPNAPNQVLNKQPFVPQPPTPPNRNQFTPQNQYQTPSQPQNTPSYPSYQQNQQYTPKPYVSQPTPSTGEELVALQRPSTPQTFQPPSSQYVPQQPTSPRQPQYTPQQYTQTPSQPSYTPQQQYTKSPAPQSYTPSVPHYQQPQQPQVPQYQQPQVPQRPQAPQQQQPQVPQYQQPQVPQYQQPQVPQYQQPQVPQRPQTPQQQYQQPSSPQQPPYGPASSPAPNPFRSIDSPQQIQNGVCVPRDKNAQPRGPGSNDAGFGEFPWQAMILRESTKTILCGGAIIESNVVATAAHCVDGIRTYDIMIKAGEWQLGVDDVKPFQTRRVVKVTMHPAYQPTNLESDIALLHLESNLNFDKHIGPICVDSNDVDLSLPNEECVTSGWGKEAIRIHRKDALPKSVSINPLSPNECQASDSGFNGNSAVCGRSVENICDADAGSALACTRGNGKYVLKGIYSREVACGSNQVVTFTKMDVNFLKGQQPSALRQQPARSSYQTQAPFQPSVSAYTPQANTPAPYVYPVPSTSAPTYLPPVGK